MKNKYFNNLNEEKKNWKYKERQRLFNFNI